MVLYVIVLGYIALQTDRHLRNAQAAVGLLRTSVTRVDSTSATLDGQLRILQHEAAAAHQATRTLPWRLATGVPVLGRPFSTVQGAATAVDGVARSVIPPVVSARDTVLHTDLRRAGGGIDLGPVMKVEGPLGRAGQAAEGLAAGVRALPVSRIGPVDRGRTRLIEQLESLTGQLHAVHDVTRVLPPMLGAQGSRRYLLAFQNNAEARGAGGLPGVYAIVQADRGKLSIVRYGVPGDFKGIRVPVSGLSQGYEGHYAGADPGRYFGNTTVSPHFPDGARLLMRYYNAKTGKGLDGAAAIDPTVLSLLLGVSGPASLPDGATVSSANVVALTERDAYQKFADPDERKRYLIGVAKAAADQILRALPAQPTESVLALRTATSQRRLLIYSTRAGEQGVLASHAVGGALSDTKNLFSGVVINNAGGNKLDYYLARSVIYQGAPCGGLPSHEAIVTIRLTNRAPKSGLSNYVAGREDHSPVSTVRGSNLLLVGYFATKGAAFSDATLDGKQALLAVDSERGRPVFTASVEIKPGQTRILRMKIAEPVTARGPVTTLVQPLVLPQTTTLRPGAGCE
ncbi:DUF4012 domain-containing protein [Phycicoccus sp. Soil748]|uniref:DUF4012 domain-containing protein n=1 Tax=Phycicoccus sp. Soil748 TaxID=1736397 RepID=UPI0012E3423D|nr:DUF4012 domain-containing protein [Phycicoccus sp. Soil748]